MINTILDRLEQEEKITEQELLALLTIDVTTQDFYTLLSRANNYSRKSFDNKGKIFAQVGIETRQCAGNCKFCALAKDTYTGEKPKEQSLETIISSVHTAVKEGASEVFLMTMADYPMHRYVEIARKIREILPSHIRMIGNVGDFDVEDARILKEVGFAGMYHICRLREGVDTDIAIETRIQTLDAIKEVGLELYYCVEPIGPEHSYEEIAKEILRATEYPVTVMAAMRRVAVPGTPLAEEGEISSAELAKIVAVALLVVRPKHAMGVHEPVEMCLMAGANQIYAEAGTNPRDTAEHTEEGRGFSVAKAKEMLKRTVWEID